MHQRSNKLGQESSPYLLQHKDNPIWWLPWGDEAFAIAAQEDKPVFLSVGYATCHWCHVMEGDSFEKDDVAAILNKYYVAIKVDREERPDVDALYMDAVQAMSGRGGWPMSVIMTPDRKPFWAGTFLPRERFKSLLLQAQKAWHEERQELERSGQQLMEHLQQSTELYEAADFDASCLRSFFDDTVAAFDEQFGGFGSQPKFPPATTLRVLLRIHRRSRNPKALTMVTKTLDAMARGGMYDHLGGGFHRYSVDNRWFAPHFEKMLYDNALIPLAYLEAWQVTGNPEYEHVIRDTLAYVERDLLLSEGVFACAEDADSEKTEGKFYTWREEELTKVLNADEFLAISDTYQTTATGNFEPEAHAAELEQAAGMGELEQANILYIPIDQSLPDTHQEPLHSARQKLIAVREQRIRPLLDDKVLTGWNGLMIATFATVGRTLNDEHYVSLAKRAGEFLWQTMWQKGKLLRRYRKGDAAISGALEDYAYLIQSYLQIYQACFDSKWLERALTLQARQDEKFLDQSSSTYFDFDGEDQTVTVRGRTLHDSAMPSGNHVAAHNNLLLSKLTGDIYRTDITGEIMRRSQYGLRRYPRAFGYAAVVLDMLLDRSPEVAMASERPEEGFAGIREMQKHFLPNVVFAADKQSPLLANRPAQGPMSIYVCQQQTCKAPVNTIVEAMTLVDDFVPLSV